MIDYNFGTLSGRQLTLRLFAPSFFERWTDDKGFRFAPWRLLNPLVWIRAIRRGGYDAWMVHHRDCNHRCYCPVGTLLDFSLVVAGWGFVAFYSYYGGPVPCVCDKTIKELFGEDEDD